MDKKFGDDLEFEGIIYQLVYKMGLLQKKNKYLLEVARSHMFTMNLPKTYHIRHSSCCLSYQ